jgi:hypothetical protein
MRDRTWRPELAAPALKSALGARGGALPKVGAKWRRWQKEASDSAAVAFIGFAQSAFRLRRQEENCLFAVDRQNPGASVVQLDASELNGECLMRSG